MCGNEKNQRFALMQSELRARLIERSEILQTTAGAKTYPITHIVCPGVAIDGAGRNTTLKNDSTNACLASQGAQMSDSHEPNMSKCIPPKQHDDLISLCSTTGENPFLIHAHTRPKSLRHVKTADVAVQRCLESSQTPQETSNVSTVLMARFKLQLVGSSAARKRGRIAPVAQRYLHSTCTTRPNCDLQSQI